MNEKSKIGTDICIPVTVKTLFMKAKCENSSKFHWQSNELKTVYIHAINHLLSSQKMEWNFEYTLQHGWASRIQCQVKEPRQKDKYEETITDTSR